MAAWLGHEPAQVALGRRARGREALRQAGHEVCVRVALAGARAALKRWGGEPPPEVVAGVAAIEAWLACPCAAHAAACREAEDSVGPLGARLLGEVDVDAPDADADDVSARLDVAERRSQVTLTVFQAALAVRAPLESGPGLPAPVSEIAFGALRSAAGAEASAARADAPPGPSDEAARRMIEPFLGGGHGPREGRGRPRDAVDEEIERYGAALAAFEAACGARVQAEVRAALVPWLLGAP
ncbi:MAG: hypothetical protein KF878_28210 [Planctomycetes bacterium]|nr:hypothetical protein [Planctomycetota bacterium]